MLSAARAEIAELLADVRTSRKPSLRRASSDDWLLACDLPLCASAEETAIWTEKACEQHWRVGRTPEGWLLLDRPDLLPTSDVLPASPKGETGALISLLLRHASGAQPELALIRGLAKAAEAGEASLERQCEILHRSFAEKLRRREPLPALLPWLCAAARTKEEKP